MHAFASAPRRQSQPPTILKHPRLGHVNTLNIAHSLPSLHNITTTQTPDWSLQSQWHELRSCEVILHYTHRLTIKHSGNFRDVPLIEVSVEGGILKKHCHKKEGRLQSQSTRKNFMHNPLLKKFMQNQLISLLLNIVLITPIPFLPKLALSCMPLHHLLATNLNPRLFRNLIGTSQTTYVVTMGVHSISLLFFNTNSLPSLHHILTTNPNPRLNSPFTI